jgi:uncharacterized NAD(P)/FAD-binding protein YdhS
MSAFPEQPAHFLDWLRSNGLQDAAPGTFAPRRKYGEYLSDLLRNEVNRSPDGAEFRQICGEAIAVTADRELAHVELSNGDSIEAGKVVLAIGNPASSSAIDAVIDGVDRLLQPSPWLGDALSLRFPSERILLLGSGLTAVDSMLALLAPSENSQVVMISRRGILPQMHAACLPAPVIAPMESHSGATSILREVRARVETMRQMGLCWRVTIDALRPISNRIWSDLSLAERQRFLRHLKPYWEPQRHRMAPVVADRIRHFREDGRLSVIAGRVRRLSRNDGSIQVRISRNGAAELEFDVDRVINCTGIQENYNDSPRPLVRRLMADGMASANDLGIGFRTDGAGALVNAEGNTSRLLFTLGPPRRGELFETTAVPEIRSQAEALARRLIES